MALNIILGGSIENLSKSLCGQVQEIKISRTYRVLELFLLPVFTKWIPWFLNIYRPKQCFSYSAYTRASCDGNRSQIIALRFGNKILTTQETSLSNFFECE